MPVQIEVVRLAGDRSKQRDVGFRLIADPRGQVTYRQLTTQSSHPAQRFSSRDTE